jgi:hypothetical protein
MLSFVFIFGPGGPWLKQLSLADRTLCYRNPPMADFKRSVLPMPKTKLPVATIKA